VDQFYQVLRSIQKKERNNGTLARVEETFYDDVHEYMDVLKQQAIKDPFSKAPAMLKEAQIIATDICQRRETKITNSAVLNIHRSYHLFTGKPQFDLVDTTPLNLTPEEEKFYFSLIDTLKNHRQEISLEKISSDDDKPEHKKIKPIETQTNTLTSETKPVETQTAAVTSHEVKPEKSETDDGVLDRLNDISKAEVIPQEERKPIEKQIAESKMVSKPQIPPKPPVRNVVPKPPVDNASKSDIEENPNAFDEADEFYDFESKKIARETELVTMLVFDDVGPIVGVDEKVYGPFRAQDLVALPLINAKIFFKNRKGRQVKI